MSTAFADLAEHTGTLIAVLGVFAGLTAVLIGAIWRIGTKLLFTFKNDVFALIETIDKKVEELITEKVQYALKKEVDPKIKEIEDRQYYLRTNMLPTYQKKEDMETWGRIMAQGFADMKDRIDALSRRIENRERGYGRDSFSK